MVEEYLQLAHEKGFKCVRIIHGKGIGVQRDMVRSILARTPFVLDWTDAPPEAGGLGATIVRLNTSEVLRIQTRIASRCKFSADSDSTSTHRRLSRSAP